MKRPNQKSIVNKVYQLTIRLVLTLCLLQVEMYSIQVFAEVPGTGSATGTNNSNPTGGTDSSTGTETSAGQKLDKDAVDDRTDTNTTLANQNTSHQDAAMQEDNGLLTQCRTMDSRRHQLYTDQMDYHSMVLGQNITGIADRTRELGLISNELGGNSNFDQTPDGNTILPTGETFAEHEARLQREWDIAKANAKKFGSEYDTALATFKGVGGNCHEVNDYDWGWYGDNGQLSCSTLDEDSYYSSDYEQDYNQKRSAALSAYNKMSTWEKKEKDAAKAFKYRASIIRGNQGQVTNARADMEASEGDLVQSHQTSGCNSTTGRSSSTGCVLTGPSFEKDEEISRMMNGAINQAETLATIQAERLMQLEIQNEYSGDFVLYETAMADIFTGELDGEVVRNQEELRMARSNLEIMAVATAGIKNLYCDVHPLSDSDSKSYHLLRAASATYLAANINDTSYYSNMSECRAQENYTEDDRDMQVRTVERAANLVNLQFEALCLRVTPDDDSLKEECNEYLDEIRGEDYKDKPKTREQALNMYQAALEAAQAELEAKNEKVMNAYENVQKGIAWVADVEGRIETAESLRNMALGLAALFYALFAASCTPFCNWGFYKTATKWALFAAALAQLLMMSYRPELKRAKSFLAQWREKLRRAKRFSHLICNWSDAKADESRMTGIAESARTDLQNEIADRKDRVLSEVEQKLEEPPEGTPGDLQPTAPTGFIDRGIINPLKGALKTASTEKEWDLAIYNIYRAKKGAVSSLPYDAFASVKKTVKKVGFAVFDQLFPASFAETSPTPTPTPPPDDPNRLAMSLGVARGSSSFEYFLVRRNEEWKKLAHDIAYGSPYSAESVHAMPNNRDPKRGQTKVFSQGRQRGNYANRGLVDVENELIVDISGLSDTEKTGFPLPETRVVTLANIIALVTSNMTLMNDALSTIRKQRDAYVSLLNDMRQRMDMTDDGLDDINTHLINNNAGKCMRQQADGSFLLDADCDCKENGNCANFGFPDFDTFAPGALTENGALSLDTANATLKGDLKSAGIAGGKLGKNAVRTKDNIKKMRDSINKRLKKNGLAQRDFDKEGEALRRGTNRRVANNLNSLSLNKDSSSSLLGTSSFSSRRRGSRGGSATDEANAKSKSAATSTGTTSAAGLKGLSRGRKSGKLALNGKDGKKGKMEEMKFVFDGESEMLGEDAGWGDEGNYDVARADGKTKGKDGEGRYGHNRSGGYGGFTYKGKSGRGGQFEGINTNRRRSIFKIISTRYKKTAFPIFLD